MARQRLAEFLAHIRFTIEYTDETSLGTLMNLRTAFVLASIAFATDLIAAAERPPTIHVLLWFDTEDYILPASDDAALKIADWLRNEGIPATFKIVGEKARTLEKRGRKDVIEALKKHEIGYHSNFHSVHPTPAMYLSALGWDEGVAEFDRREKSGFDDVKRIFGQTPSCYGQPGSSWGPQSYGALRKWGVPLYLDYGKHIGMDGKPMWYGGALNIYNHANTLRTNLEGEKELAKARDRFVEVHKQLLAEGGGLVSIYYHPCEFVHKQFWDGANFDKGANPPREKWKLPEAKSAEEIKIAYDTFFAYIRFIKRFAEVKFITGKDAGELYKDKAIGREFGNTEIKAIAGLAAKGLNYHMGTDFALAPSEILKLLCDYEAPSANPGPKQSTYSIVATPFGPSAEPRAMAAFVETDRGQLSRTALDVSQYMEKHGRVPSTIWLGSAPVTPESFLAALVEVVRFREFKEPDLPEKIALKPAKLLTEKYVAEENPKLWGWTIFPPGFSAPEMMKLAKRQAWTIKPAIMHGIVKE